MLDAIELAKMVHFTKKNVAVSVIAILLFALLYSPSTLVLTILHDSNQAAGSALCEESCPTLTPIAIYKRYKASAYVSHN
jgi:hypothetical protein